MDKGKAFCIYVLAVALFAYLATVSTVIAADQFAGEVLKVDVAAKKLTVKKADGNRFTFVVDEKTAFGGARKSLDDLTKGDKVTVDFQVTAGQYKAVRVTSP